MDSLLAGMPTSLSRGGLLAIVMSSAARLRIAVYLLVEIVPE